MQNKTNQDKITYLQKPYQSDTKIRCSTQTQASQDCRCNPFSILNKKLEQRVSKWARPRVETRGQDSFLSCWRPNFKFELLKQQDGKNPCVENVAMAAWSTLSMVDVGKCWSSLLQDCDFLHPYSSDGIRAQVMILQTLYQDLIWNKVCALQISVIIIVYDGY